MNFWTFLDRNIEGMGFFVFLIVAVLGFATCVKGEAVIREWRAPVDPCGVCRALDGGAP